MTTTNRYAAKLLKFLSGNREGLAPLLIVMHDYPDPDAISSAFALKYIAEKAFGINCRIVYGGLIGRVENRTMVRILKIPVFKLHKTDFKKYKNTVLIDTQPSFENNSFPKKRKATIVIDQHASVVRPLCDLALIDTKCGATAVILADALLSLNIDVPQSVATALAYGILTDTLNLYRAERSDIVKIYLKILHYADLKALAQIQNPVRSRKFFTNLSKGIYDAVVKKRVVVSRLSSVENPDLVAQVAEFLLTYKNVDRSICLGRYQGRLYVSLRISNTGVDAGDILRDVFEDKGKAGGHDVIAGGSMRIGKNVSEEIWLNHENNLVRRFLKRCRVPVGGDPHYPFR